MIRCIVFDFDGTLVESNHIKQQSFLDIANNFENGLAAMKIILKREDCGDRYWIFEEFVEQLSLTINSSELINQYTQLCEEQIIQAVEVAGATQSLKELHKKGIKLFINSATPDTPLKEIVRLRNMDCWFDGIYGSQNKNAENLQTIMELCNVDTTEVIMVGDGELDREGAEKVGCKFVGVKNNFNNFLLPPVYLIDNLENFSENLENFL